MNKQDIVKEIIKRRVVAVVRVSDTGKLKQVIQAVYTGGVSAIEITLTVPNAIQQIERMNEELSGDVLLGVGSVLNAQQAEDAIKAGAKYVVSPILKKEIISIAHKYEVPAMPGVFTPTEIQQAFEYGADVIKVFPADVVGMKFFKGVLAPMPHSKLMPTGGVTLTNAGDWLKAGACAVGIGSALLDKKAIDSNNFNALTENAKTLMNSIKEFENLEK